MTLIEVLVSLVVVGVAVATARAVTEQISVAGRASVRVLDVQLQQLARTEELRRLFGLAAAPRDSTEVFDGDVNSATLTSRCSDARGFEGDCRCNVSVRPGEDAGSVVERSCDAGSRPDTLVVDTLGLRILYLVDAAAGGRWITEWRNANSLPRAVGIVRSSRGDTLIVRVGERG